MYLNFSHKSKHYSYCGTHPISSYIITGESVRSTTLTPLYVLTFPQKQKQKKMSKPNFISTWAESKNQLRIEKLPKIVFFFSRATTSPSQQTTPNTRRISAENKLWKTPNYHQLINKYSHYPQSTVTKRNFICNDAFR